MSRDGPLLQRTTIRILSRFSLAQAWALALVKERAQRELAWFVAFPIVLERLQRKVRLAAPL